MWRGRCAVTATRKLTDESVRACTEHSVVPCSGHPQPQDRIPASSVTAISVLCCAYCYYFCGLFALSLSMLDNEDSRDSSIGIATGYRLETGVRFPVGARNFSPLHSFQTGSGAYPASYPMGTGASFSWGKEAGA
jgi:hypothetical protein